MNEKTRQEQFTGVATGALILGKTIDPKTIANLQVGRETSLFKRAILVYSGIFHGMFGLVEITDERLGFIADRYNADRANPQNDNDYAPLLKDHDRAVDNVLGRLLPPFNIIDWVKPDTGETVKALECVLRIDDELAIKNTNSGKYAHLSISFDEETYETFETSFVAVEAARRSIALNKGKPEESEMKTELAAANKKVTSLTGNMSKIKLAISGYMQLSATDIIGGIKEVDEFHKSVAVLKVELLTAGLRSKFKALGRQGKINKAEYDKQDFATLAAIGKAGYMAVLASFDARKPSTDIMQHGDKNSNSLENGLVKYNKNSMKAAIALQRKNKGGIVNLINDDDDDDKDNKDKEDKDLGGHEDDDDKGPELDFDSLQETVDKVEEMAGIANKFKSLLEKLQSSMEKMNKETEVVEE